MIPSNHVRVALIKMR